MGHVDQERQALIHQALTAGGLDAFVCATPTNVLMLTGYWPVIGKSVAIATADGNVEVIIPEDEAELADGCRAQISTYAPARLERPISLAEALSKPLKAALSKLGLMSLRIGVETGPQLIPGAYVSIHVFNCELSELLAHLAPAAKLVTADSELAKLRSRLTPSELNRLRLSCDLAGVAFDQVPDLLAAGIPEAELAAKLSFALASSAGYEGVRRVGGSFFCMSGPNAAKASAAFQMSTSRQLQDGDFVLIHCNSHADGFWTDITRTYIVGRAAEQARTVLEAIQEARLAALQTVKPGVKAAEVDAAARDVMSARGFGQQFMHGLGHGVGFVAIDHDAMPRLTPNSSDILEPGMAFNIEPGAYFDGWGGARHCDMVVCGDTGSEVLTPFS